MELHLRTQLLFSFSVLFRFPYSSRLVFVQRIHFFAVSFFFFGLKWLKYLKSLHWKIQFCECANKVCDSHFVNRRASIFPMQCFFLSSSIIKVNTHEKENVQLNYGVQSIFDKPFMALHAKSTRDKYRCTPNFKWFIWKVHWIHLSECHFWHVACVLDTWIHAFLKMFLVSLNSSSYFALSI